MSIEQTPEVSMEDRITSQFADQPEEQGQEQPQEAEAEAPEAEAEAAPELVEVEIDGELFQVPPKMKDKLMAHKDYTTKTQEVAEQRRLVEVRAQQLKAVEAEREFERAAREDILEMQKIDFQIEQYKNIDATGLTSDQLWQLSRTIEKLKDDRSLKSQKLTEKYNQFQQEQTKLAQEAMTKAQEAAAKAVPNWSPEVQKQIRDFAVSQGFEAQELNSVSDPRVVKILWQASQYAKLSQAKISGKVNTTPAVKPGSSNPMPQSVKENFAFKKALKTAPTSQAKAKAIEAELMRRF